MNDSGASQTMQRVFQPAGLNDTSPNLFENLRFGAGSAIRSDVGARLCTANRLAAAVKRRQPSDVGA